MTKDELYKILTTIIDRKHFDFDHIKQKITLHLPFNWDAFKFAKKNILAIFGNPHIPQGDWEDNLIPCEYKFDSHFIEIDEETIKIDKWGRLFVDYNDIKDKLQKAILSDEDFLNKLARKAIRRTRKHSDKNKKSHTENDHICQHEKPPIGPRPKFLPKFPRQ